jgi:hypothetical protein
MDRFFGVAKYTSHRVRDVNEGYEGYELVQFMDGEHLLVARIVYVDAAGHYYVETFGVPVPLDILEELISETRENVKYK